ncbi:hypothetical protein PUMCH_004023 [Australozyma saopauloensis]|uniref:Uncharacterized protein n=1 Tax=Australozyma saopauloensis TaxID=291208 RepID=A0AAX4HDZ3_9ASCO|nr:hypothetical protein PUMCH_004023 [[Candida] saopauloensis]
MHAWRQSAYICRYRLYLQDVHADACGQVYSQKRITKQFFCRRLMKSPVNQIERCQFPKKPPKSIAASRSRPIPFPSLHTTDGCGNFSHPSHGTPKTTLVDVLEPQRNEKKFSHRFAAVPANHTPERLSYSCRKHPRLLPRRLFAPPSKPSYHYL